MLFLKENVFSHVTVSDVIRWICVQKANLQLFKNNSPTFNVAFNTKHAKKVNFKWILLGSFFLVLGSLRDRATLLQTRLGIVNILAALCRDDNVYLINLKHHIATETRGRSAEARRR